MFAGLWQDLRYGARVLRKTPAFTLVAVLTLGLCIGANTAMFSIVNGVLLRPLPLAHPERLVTFWLTAPVKKINEVNLTPGLFAYIRERSHAFEAMAAYDTGTLNLTGQGEPEQVDAAEVSPDYFDVLGVQPVLGHGFTREQEQHGKGLSAVLSHELWLRRFHADPGILGRAIDLDGTPMVVAGVMPPHFEFPNRAEGSGLPPRIEVWVPLELDPQNINYWNYLVVGRLRPGFEARGAQRELTALWNGFEREHGAELGGGALGPGVSAVVKSLQARVVGEVRTPMLVLLCAMGLVLLIACADLASLTLIRGSARRSEIALRCCLGASAQRIARQQLAESVVLAALGGALGLLIGWWAIEAFRQQTIVEVPFAARVGLDAGAVLVSLALTLLAVTVLGLAPALGATRLDLQNALKPRMRGAGRTPDRRLNSGFVIAQFALSLLLLAGAGLLIQSFRNLLAIDPGFHAQAVWSGRVGLAGARYDSESQQRAFFGSLLERARNLPGVRSAALCQVVPFSGGGGGYPFTIEGHVLARGEPTRDAWRRSVTPDYFTTLGIPIVRGRAFSPTDDASAQAVAIVDAKLARAYWPGADPIGRRLKIGGPDSNAPWLTVVGVVASVKNRRLDEDAKFTLYQPFEQWPQREMSLVLRSDADPAALTPGVRRALAELDPALPLYSVTTVADDVRRSLTTRRLTNAILTGLALSALLLSVLGIYGVMSLSVGSRTHEFGVRMALGATPAALLRLVLGQGMRLTLAGIALGLAGAIGLTGLMKGLLYGVAPGDPVVLAAVAGVLGTAALAACYLPARRATTVDPIVALREE